MQQVQWYSPKTGFPSIPVIVVEAQRSLHVVILDTPVRFCRVPKEEARKMIPAQYKGKEYPVRRAVRIARSMGRQFGISQAAKNLLKEVTA